MNPEIVVVYFIVAFSFALIMIMKKETLPDRLRKPLAIMAIFLVAVAFGLMVYSFFI